METIRLQSGTEVLIRPIRPDDGPRIETAFDRLSPRTRYQRFLSSKPRLTKADTRYLVEVDGSDHVALVATLTGDPEQIVGVGRFIRLPTDAKTAEFAIVVLDEFQSDGLGTALLQRLTDAARDRGIERVTATLLVDNPPVHRLLARLSGEQSRRRFGPVEEIELRLAA